MYVVTFYSYKGGVGRTMTLVNTAAELIKRGRKVLLVDFDLEAPGLTSYGFCESAASRPGVVDYISEYSRTLVAPDVRDFISTCEIEYEGNHRSLWVMSAGKQDEKYRENFYSIDWQELYAEKSGYLMMEDIKEQWKRCFDPDYVLIDSRTGITDISGICTRQLPDAVAVVFFPNRQNLSGLKRVVNEVRGEKTSGRRKDITLHFISSNTPSADDEDGILRRNLEEFRKALKYDASSIIHYYNSLSIVDQIIFTLHKPRTQLAEEYRQLVDRIVKSNPADRDGALAYLGELAADRKNVPSHGGIAQVDQRLEIIQEHFPADGEIFNRIADVNMTLLRSDRAIDLYKEAIRRGYRKPDTFRNLALAYLQSNDKQNMTEALYNLLDCLDASMVDVSFALKWISEIDEAQVPAAFGLPAVRAQSAFERYVLTDQFLGRKKSLLPTALAVMDEIVKDPSLEQVLRAHIVASKSLLLIAVGRFHDAMQTIGDREQLLATGPIQRVFNRAMAEWAAYGAVPKDLMNRVVELNAEKGEPTQDPNYAQCLAVACWAIGMTDAARNWIGRARQDASDKKASDEIFSCWRYLSVPKNVFLEDTDQIEAMIENSTIRPEFFARDKSTTVH
jgi:MinD-like ATPase involved in chromosome partitioning or flagellar assembly